MFETLSTQPKLRSSQWLLVSTAMLLLMVAMGLVFIMLLNGGIINHLLTPVMQYLSLFKVLWDENAFGAVQFLLSKSLLAFAYQDPKSGLNVWTYDFDSYSAAVYIIAALVGGRIIARQLYFHRSAPKLPLALSFIGMCLLASSMSYMTAIAHCSGPTWVGFVSLYGLGLDEFQLYPVYQILVAVIGIVLLAIGLYQTAPRMHNV